MSARLPDNAVAVTGMACRFPAAPDLETYWRNICDGIEAIARFDNAELRRAGVNEELLRHPSFVPACAPVPDPFAFDAAHFGIAPATARVLDPQHRVFLECAWGALEASGMLAAERRAVGVFAGCSEATFGPLTRGSDDGQAGVLAAHLGSNPDYLASRVAFLLNLQGPAVTVLAACATSMVAVHLAVQSLLTRECDWAVAGGVAIRHPLRRGHVYEPGGIYSSDGRCRPYDHLSSGIVSGDGAGAVVLRRLEDAVAAGDHIHAVIRGSAVTNDGARKGGFTAPSVEGQVEAAVTALEVADIDPATIGFVEGHGTATPLGDPIEVEALRRAWATGSDRDRSCVLGSVKSSIGHLDAAAGIAGFIKACLAVERGRIPATLHYAAPNPHAGLVGSPFVVSSETLDWKELGPRRASVHSLGLGGTNAHVVLEQAPASEIAAPQAGSVPVILTLAASCPDSLDRYAKAVAKAVESPACDEAEAAYTLQSGRVPAPYRRTVVGCERETLVRDLLALEHPSPRPVGVASRLVIAFPGDGKRTPGAISRLAEHLPPVAATLHVAAAHLKARWGIDLFAALDAAESSRAGIIPATVAQGAAIHAALAHFGAGGDLVLGQSLGELTAAVASGLLELPDALDLAVARERAFRAIVPSGAVAIHASPDTVINRLKQGLELALVNSPERCVVSGKLDVLERLSAELRRDDIPVYPLELVSAVHSSLLDPVLGDYRRAAERLRFCRPTRRFLSTVDSLQLDERSAADPEHWVRHLRETVRFDHALRVAVTGHPNTVVVDAGAAGGLTAAVHETVGREVRAIVKLSASEGGPSEIEAFAQALGRLWEHGVPIDWTAWPRAATRRTFLPVPPLSRTVYEPAGDGSVTCTVPANTVGLWARGWQRTATAGAGNRVRRVAVLAGADPFSNDIGASLARVCHDVNVINRVGLPEVVDRFGLVVDARGLGESDGPAAVGQFLELVEQMNRSKDTPRLTVLTRGAFDIDGTEVLSPVAAGLAAACLVAAQESEGLELNCLDLGRGGDSELLARVLTTEHRSDVWLGLRGRRVWQPVPEQVRPRQGGDRRFAGRACVLFGGLGRFGRWVGRWLSEHGCTDLFLVGRTDSAQGPATDAVAAMRAAGAHVTVVRADVTDRAALFAVLEDAARACGGRVTVFHLAGEPHAASAFSTIADLARADPRRALEEQWSAKVKGALLLLDWTRRHPETRCVVFSSNSAVLGGPGLAAYATANAAVDAIATSARDREGLDWCSIGWDGWRLPDDAPTAVRTALESVALRGPEPWEALCEAVVAEHGHVVVAKGDFVERHRVWVKDRGRAYVGLDQDAARPAPETTDDLTAVVRRIWSEVLGAAPGHDDINLFEVGGDSLSAMRLRARIERELGVQLTLKEVLNNRTVARLVALIQPRVLAEAFPEPPDAKRTIYGRI
ncbi:MAG: SDR family NAD(P)-dependent oxidoreductase [Planctomycetaceae bacterium]|nr:SDR family NAD(P)-dependent oxidoreductase [Planctomycetaceae bacterium]